MKNNTVWRGWRDFKRFPSSWQSQSLRAPTVEEESSNKLPLGANRRSRTGPGKDQIERAAWDWETETNEAIQQGASLRQFASGRKERQETLSTREPERKIYIEWLSPCHSSHELYASCAMLLQLTRVHAWFTLLLSFADPGLSNGEEKHLRVNDAKLSKPPITLINATKSAVLCFMCLDMSNKSTKWRIEGATSEGQIYRQSLFSRISWTTNV